VCKIKDDCGAWIDNQQAIVEKFIQDYTNRFHSGGQSNLNSLEPQWCNRVSDEDNLHLVKIPDMIEV